MATRSVPRGKRGWRRIAADPADVGPLLREAGFVGCKDDPSEVTACFDRADRPRRIDARYPNGWRCHMMMRADGTHSLVQSLTMRVVGGKAGA